MLWRHLLFVVLAVTACSTEPVTATATQTLVYVHADPAVAPAARGVRVHVYGEGELQETKSAERPEADAIIANLFLSPQGRDANRTWELRIELVSDTSTTPPFKKPSW